MQNDNMEQNNLNIQSENYSEQPQNPEYVGDYNMYQQPMGDYNYQQAGSFDMQQNYVDPNQMGYVDPNQAYMNTQQMGYVDPNQAYMDPNMGYVDPSQMGYVDPNQAYMNTQQMGYVDPNQAYMDPNQMGYVDPNQGYVEQPQMVNEYVSPEASLANDMIAEMSAYSDTTQPEYQEAPQTLDLTQEMVQPQYVEQRFHKKYLNTLSKRYLKKFHNT